MSAQVTECVRAAPPPPRNRVYGRFISVHIYVSDIYVSDIYVYEDMPLRPLFMFCLCT